jgi:hypothetical protein
LGITAEVEISSFSDPIQRHAPASLTRHNRALAGQVDSGYAIVNTKIVIAIQAFKCPV